MTVLTTCVKKTYTGDGKTTRFSFPCKVYDPAHIKVTVKDEAFDIKAIENLGSDNGVIIVFSNPPSQGAEITIERSIPCTQPIDLSDYFSPQAVEAGFDHITMLVQQCMGGEPGDPGTPPSDGDYVPVTGGTFTGPVTFQDEVTMEDPSGASEWEHVKMGFSGQYFAVVGRQSDEDQDLPMITWIADTQTILIPYNWKLVHDGHIAEPTDNAYVTKKWVLDNIGGGGDDNFVPISGGTFTGNVEFEQDIVQVVSNPNYDRIRWTDANTNDWYGLERQPAGMSTWEPLFVFNLSTDTAYLNNKLQLDNPYLRWSDAADQTAWTTVEMGMEGQYFAIRGQQDDESQMLPMLTWIADTQTILVPYNWKLTHDGQIQNPTDNEYITRKWAEDNLGGSDGNYLPITGGTLTGDLHFSAYNHVVFDDNGGGKFSMGYVQMSATAMGLAVQSRSHGYKAFLYYEETSGWPNGRLMLGGSGGVQIYSGFTPASPEDVTNKAYVDSKIKQYVEAHVPKMIKEVLNEMSIGQ